MSNKKRIHVFASDSLPFPGCSRTAGGNRSMQIISALRQAGHMVTFSTPLHNFIAKANAERVLAHLTKDELWASENFFQPEAVLNRFQPDIAITCNINTFRTIARFSEDIVQIVDCYGPLQFEGLLLDSPDPEAAMSDPAALEERCRQTVNQIRGIDYLVTVSERQKYFWAAYCSMAGFAFNELDVLVCPAAFDVPSVPRKAASQLTVVYSGGFYPWQNPDRSLRSAAEILDTIPGAALHIYGGPHAGLPNADSVNRMLSDLQQFSSVTYHGYRPVEELAERLATAWCALELMERNIERELAVTGRTVEFLSAGTPVVYNNYSTLSRYIHEYNAGWTISPDNASTDLRAIFNELITGGPGLVEELSINAKRLAATVFSPEQCMAPLVQLCDKPISKRRRYSAKAVTSSPKPKSLGNVLAISPDTWGGLRDVRISNPLRSLHRQKYIDRPTIIGPSLDNLRHDHTAYDVIVVHRAIPEWIYNILIGLGLRFLQDVDDNVLAAASYRRHHPIESQVLDGLANCTVLTVPTPRLARALEHYSGIPLGDKAFVTPNALPFPSDLAGRTPTPPSQIIWIQSDTAALDKSKANIVKAVDDFSRDHELPVLLVGRQVFEKPDFKHQIALGQLEFTALVQFLEFAPTSIGVAPLETEADHETLAFVGGKSDLKMLFFSGYGHPGVYSAAPPYTDSPLQDGLAIVPNSYEQWREALEVQYKEGWRDAGEIARRIQHQRHVDCVAAQSWLPALEAAVLSRPVRGSDLYEASRGASRMDENPARSIAYMLANTDVMDQALSDSSFNSWKHYLRFGVNEHRRLIHNADAYFSFLKKLEKQHKRLSQKEKAEIQELRKRITSLESELTTAHATISGVLQSKSWKVTAPIRSLSSRLK